MLQAINSGKRLCAHLLVFDKTPFYEDHMYFLHDTHHGTLFSTFSSIYRPKMETKTGQFRTISDSATRSTSCRRFFVVRFCCGEISFFLISNSGRTIPTLAVLLQLLLNLSKKNGNKYVPIQDCFGFSHALHLLQAVF